MATYNAKTLTLVNQNGDVYVIDPLQGNESVYLDLPVTITQNQWSGTAPYTYTYTNSHITANAALCVYFKDGVREGLVGDLKWSKATGSITFVTTEPAAGPVPLVVRVIDSTTNGTYPVDASMVETDAIVGETTVQGCLEDLDSRVTNNTNNIGTVPTGKTLQGQIDDVWKTIYPIGSIYMSVASTSPETLFGGTWAQLKDRFLLGAGDTYTAGDTGGNATHTLTTNEMPSHSHGLNNHTHTYDKVNSPTGGPSTTNTGNVALTTAQLASHKHSVNFGQGTTATTGDKYGYAQTGTTWSTSHDTNNTGSGNNHAHTLNSHTHTTSTTSTNSGQASGSTESNGSGTAFSIMPPYLAVYMWKRTA